MAAILGNAILITVGTALIAAQKSASMSLSRATIDITSKDSDADYKEILVARKEGSMQVESVYDPAAATGTGALDMFTAYNAGTKVTVKMGQTTAAGKYFTSSAYITDFSLEGPMDDAAAWSATLTLDGEVTVGTVAG